MAVPERNAGGLMLTVSRTKEFYQIVAIASAKTLKEKVMEVMKVPAMHINLDTIGGGG